MVDRHVKYSVVMPVYNGRNYFPEALMSAIETLGENDEIVVVEDGSTDGGVEDIVANMHDHRINYYFKVNGGVASALNLGIRKAKNPYFCWLSHDDLFLKNRLIEDRKLRNFCPDIITFSSFYTFTSEKKYARLINKKEFAVSKHFATFLLSRRFLNGCTVTAPICKLFELGLFDEDLKHTQDYDMWLKLLEDEYFSYIETPLVMSRQHAHQDSKKMPREARQEFRQLLRRHYSKLEIRFSLAFELILLIKSF